MLLVGRNVPAIQSLRREDPQEDTKTMCLRPGAPKVVRVWRMHEIYSMQASWNATHTHTHIPSAPQAHDNLPERWKKNTIMGHNQLACTTCMGNMASMKFVKTKTTVRPHAGWGNVASRQCPPSTVPAWLQSL